MSAVKGRFGYYPCSYEIYRKLKDINFIILLTLRHQAAWIRWARKQPHNRKFAEPNVCPVFTEKMLVKSYRDLGGNWFDDKIEYSMSTWTAFAKEIVGSLTTDYKNARYPKPDAENVKPLLLNDELINKAHEMCLEYIP